jgi:hypothetical protein
MSEQLFNELGKGLDDAIACGVLPNPGAPPGAKGTRNDTDSRSYILALRTRLIDLGYLEDSDGNRNSAVTDQDFIAAVECFQREVGGDTLKQDGWAGPKTWGVLQCLVSFEDEQEPRNWEFKISFHNNPAVARAAWLRLWVMGFFVDGENAREKDWERSKLGFKASADASAILGDEAFSVAFSRFWDFAGRLGLLTGGLPAVPRFDAQCLGVLFNYDGIIRALSSAEKDRGSNSALDDFHDLFENFTQQIEAIARIEFWLLGYNCTPGLPNSWKSVTLPGGKSRQERVPQLPAVIADFWRDHKDRRGEAPHDSVSPALFVEFGNLLDEPENKIADPDQVVMTVSTVLNEDQSRDKRDGSFIDTFMSLASSIWDGVKRLAKFIWRLIRGAVSAVTNLVRNLARYIASEAREFFYIVARAVDAVHGGIDYLRNSIYPKKLPASVVIARGADFDHFMLLDSSVTKLTETVEFSEYQRQAECYCAGCVILGELVGQLGIVVQLATGALAGPLLWLRALLALGRFRSSIDRVKEALKELDEHYLVSGSVSGALLLTDVA